MHQCFFLLHFIFSTFRSSRCHFSLVVLSFSQCYIYYFCFLRYSCREQWLLLSRWVFSSFVFLFSNIHDTSVANNSKIDFKVFLCGLYCGYERLTFQGVVPTLPRIVLCIIPRLNPRSNAYNRI